MPPRATFPRSVRIRSSAEFSAVFEPRVRASGGPLSVHGMPNHGGFSRLGLSTPRRVGIAAVRNRVRRMLRESFRLLQHELPSGYDWVIVARPHAPLSLAEYQALMRKLFQKVHIQWQRQPPAETPSE